jgi:UDP-3-O-[3-hydroxymyristoyl] glucosamine N-acyltransferase
MEATIREIAALVGGKVVGDSSASIHGVNGIEDAAQGEITFLDHPKYESLLETTSASAVLVPEEIAQGPTTLIQVQAPRLAFAQLLGQFSVERTKPPQGVHPQSVVGENVQLGADVGIDAFVRIADNVTIGDGAVIYAGSYIAHGATIGAHSVIYSNVTIREDVRIGDRCILHSGVILGSDGFGFAAVGGEQEKIPQVGTVILGDDVEIGSNSCVDRATFGETTIGRGTKIDNLVQIGHNVRIGEHCVVSGLCGISGTTTIGNRVTVGGQVGFAGHLTVGDDVVIGARSGVTKSISAGQIVSGFPACDHEEARRIRAGARRLPSALKRLRELEDRLREFERRLDGKPEDHS